MRKAILLTLALLLTTTFVDAQPKGKPDDKKSGVLQTKDEGNAIAIAEAARQSKERAETKAKE